MKLVRKKLVERTRAEEFLATLPGQLEIFDRGSSVPWNKRFEAELTGVGTRHVPVTGFMYACSETGETEIEAVAKMLRQISGSVLHAEDGRSWEVPHFNTDLTSPDQDLIFAKLKTSRGPLFSIITKSIPSDESA